MMAFTFFSALSTWLYSSLESFRKVSIEPWGSSRRFARPCVFFRSAGHFLEVLRDHVEVVEKSPITPRVFTEMSLSCPRSPHLVQQRVDPAVISSTAVLTRPASGEVRHHRSQRCRPAGKASRGCGDLRISTMVWRASSRMGLSFAMTEPMTSASFGMLHLAVHHETLAFVGCPGSG